MSTLAVAVAQFAPVADREANLTTVAELVARAGDRGAGLVVLPEYSSFFIDPFDASLAEHAETRDGPFVESLGRLAAEHAVTIVAGMCERSDTPGKVFNTLVAVDGAGIRATYRKIHLYDAFGQRESDWVEAGAITEPETFEVDGVRLGLMTCYDLRFPEVARVLADADVHGILVPAQWVRGALKETQWQTLLRARAIENTLFVAAADHPPPLGVGHSAIIDPLGVVVAGIGTATDVAVAHVDSDAVARVRRVNPALSLRRFEVRPRPVSSAPEGRGETG